MISFDDPSAEGKQKAQHALDVRRVCALAEGALREQAWVKALPPDEFRDGLNGLSVSVAELQCREQGCVPLETVFTVMRASAPTRLAKVLKVIADVTAEDVVEVVQAQLSTDNAPALHHVYTHIKR